MKRLHLGACLLGALGLTTLVFVACDAGVAPGPDGDAAADTGLVSPSDVSVADTSVADTSIVETGPDASTDASIDASTDASMDSGRDTSVDAADAAPPCGASAGRLCALGEGCVVSSDCASPNLCEANVCARDPMVQTMADIVDLGSFDFEGTTLVYTVGTPSVYACTFPGCADAAAIPNITQSLRTGLDFPISVAGGFVHYPVTGPGGPGIFLVAARRSTDGAVGGGSSRIVCTDALGRPGSLSIASAHSGADGWSGLFKCVTDRTAPGAFRYQFAPSLAGVARVDRVGRGSRSVHSNGDATARLVPGSQTVTPVVTSPTDLESTVLGTIRWGNSESPAPPSEMVTSPKSFGGVDLVYPAVAMRQGQSFGVVRRGAPGLVFPLGTGATTINIDERYLYVGTASGLGRCALSEIGTLNSCTLAPLSAGEAVEAPLYISATHAWYKSGTRVRRVAK